MTVGTGEARQNRAIQVLRGLAALLVVIGHAIHETQVMATALADSPVDGSFVRWGSGVDIFFVISGFLISGIIFSGLERQRFSFRDFYARRIRRIFPALIVVLAAAYAAGWFLLFADRFAELGKHAAGGAGFVANYVLWREAGYFDGASDTKPFLHLWSLGVEEQFYLIWPLAAWLAWKRRFDLLGITLVVFAGSMFLNLDRIRRDLIGTFYSPETRFWELMTGAMLAHVMSMPARWKALDWLRRLYTRLTATAASRSRLSITGAILIAVSIFGIVSPPGQRPGSKGRRLELQFRDVAQTRNRLLRDLQVLLDVAAHVEQRGPESLLLNSLDDFPVFLDGTRPSTRETRPL